MTEASPSQQITTEWLLQRTQFSNDAEFQSSAWIAPATLETFRDQNVLECGCGGGDHTLLVAAIARTVTAVDLNTATLARNRMKDFTNVEFVEAELISMNLGQWFDVAFCVGVSYQTDNLTCTFENIYRHLKPGGTIIIYGYASEGNWPMRYIAEPAQLIFVRHLPRWLAYVISVLVTAAMYPVVYTLYRLPIANQLPYFKNFLIFGNYGGAKTYSIPTTN